MKNESIRIFVLILCVASGVPKVSGEPANTNDNSKVTSINSSSSIPENGGYSTFSLKAYEGKTIRAKLTDVAAKKHTIISIQPNQKILVVPHTSKGWHRLEIEEYDSSKEVWAVINASTFYLSDVEEA